MKFRLKDSQKMAELTEKLSLRELLEQIICPSYYWPEDGEKFKNTGAVYMHKKDREEVIRRIGTLQNSRGIPAFVLADLECGAGNMIDGATEYGTMMGLSQANSEELAYELGMRTAQDALAVGYNWTLGPVVDLAGSSNCPIISTRSAGKNPQQVRKITSAYMKGLQDNGLIATAKHFPGDGYCQYDQHLTTAENPLDMESWRKLSGLAFQNIIDDGVIAVMPGHISLPAYDDIDEETGICPPATLSKKLMCDLLRGEMGFEGIIISDAINMGGSVGYMEYYKACATFFENGGDCLLFPIIDEIFFDQMERLIAAGMLQVSTVKNRAYRMLCLKEQMGLFNKNQKTVEPDIQKSEKLSETITRRAVTVVRDRKQLIPFAIKKDTKILQLVIMNDAEQHMPKINRILEELKQYSEQVTQIVDPGPDELFQICRAKQYDLIVCMVGNTHLYGVNVVRLHGPVARNMMGGWNKMDIPVIFVAMFHPYIHKEYEASVDTLINTYGYTKHTAKALLDVITGKQDACKTLVHD